MYVRRDNSYFCALCEAQHHDELSLLRCTGRNVGSLYTETHQHTPGDAVSHPDEILCYLTPVTTILFEWIWHLPVVGLESGHWTVTPTTAGVGFIFVWPCVDLETCTLPYFSLWLWEILIDVVLRSYSSDLLNPAQLLLCCEAAVVLTGKLIP